MNIIFLLIITLAFGVGAVQQLLNPNDAIMQHLTQELLLSANQSVSIAIGLVGVLALFLGLVKILEEAGFVKQLGRAIYPWLRFLFPEIPADHPALGAITLNMSANLLGLGNAATPFGIRAMQALHELNTTPGTASHAMILFLAINTSSLTLLPTKVIALRVEAQSIDPAGIISTTLFATLCSTFVAIVVAKLFKRLYTSNTRGQKDASISNKAKVSLPTWMAWISLLFVLSLIPITLYWGARFSPWIIPSLFFATILYGAYKKIRVYDCFVEGAKEGFDIALKIIPYLVAILAAISLLRASGALEAFTKTIGPYTNAWGLPADAIPMALMRPLSGSGSFGILTEIFHNPDLGPDSYVGYLVSTMMGSTETTFYVLAVYFGAIQIKRLRYAVPAALCADFAGIMASIFAVKFFLA